MKGIEIGNTEFLMSQYADHTTIILDGSKNSLQTLMSELESFYIMSGLKMNQSKTQVVWIGSTTYSNYKLF